MCLSSPCRPGTDQKRFLFYDDDDDDDDLLQKLGCCWVVVVGLLLGFGFLGWIVVVGFWVVGLD